MATQPLYQSHNPSVRFPVKPNIRVVFSVGDAAVAVRSALAELSPAVRNATLDEIAIAEQAAAAIRHAHRSLSPQCFAAFLKWGAAASALATTCASDEESSRLLDILLDAMADLGRTRSGNLADLVFKTYVLALEATGSSCLGPMRETNRDEDCLVERFAYEVYLDIRNLDALPGMLDRLGAAGWSLSGSTVAYKGSIGDAITGAFMRAIADADDVDAGYLNADPHTAWLAERNNAQAIINTSSEQELSDEAAEVLLDQVTELDARIVNAPAVTNDGVIAKLALVTQLGVEGSEVNPDWIASVLANTIRVTGMGSLSAAIDEQHRGLAA